MLNRGYNTWNFRFYSGFWLFFSSSLLNWLADL